MPFEIEHEGKKLTVWTQEEVDQEVKGLKVTNENLKAEKTELAEKMREAKELASKHEEDLAKAKGDTEKLQQIAEQREAEKRQAVEDERKRFSDLLNMTKQEKITNFIDSILDEVKTADNTRRKQLKKLLKVDYEFDVDIEKGEFKVRGDNVATRDDLIRTLKESDEYKSFLAGSGATGGGATGGTTSGVGKKFNELSGAELKELRSSDPATYDRLRKEFYG
jgi:small-conductance mechanosensitive channel